MLFFKKEDYRGKWPSYHKAHLIIRLQYYPSTKIFKAANRHGSHATYSGKKM